MRRQKRDLNDRAFQRGYAAGVSGKSSDICPHANLTPAASGYQAGEKGEVTSSMAWLVFQEYTTSISLAHTLFGVL